ncbi:YfaZ family outer membrane protein [Escherichia coli]|uniref:YfaZ family outer membrane protein n=2 Tax=Escherichia coli TaxID=562 RepID=UPI00135D4E7C|nr:YfaZ family outer membrane protein [Escherichia coli]MXF07428.1 porin [Escherichia coli]
MKCNINLYSKCYIRIPLFVAALGAMVSTNAMAMGGTFEQGKDFSGLNFELGKTSGGLYLETNTIKNTKSGKVYGDLGIGYNINLDVVTFNAGAKVSRVKPKGDEKIRNIYPYGGGVTIHLPANFSIYGEGYTSSKSWGDGKRRFVEVDGGISWKPFAPLVVKAGYRYAGLQGKHQSSRNSVVEGFYLGGGIQF